MQKMEKALNIWIGDNTKKKKKEEKKNGHC
jgi:hypothetical protein